MNRIVRWAGAYLILATAAPLAAQAQAPSGEPSFEVVLHEDDLMLPMRDGVRMSTNV